MMGGEMNQQRSDEQKTFTIFKIYKLEKPEQKMQQKYNIQSHQCSTYVIQIKKRQGDNKRQNQEAG